MKYGMCYCYWSKDWEGNNYPKTIERTRRCGYDILEIFYSRLLSMEESEVNDIKAACRDNDVELYVSGGFGKDQDMSQIDERARRAAVEKAKNLSEAIARVGAHNFSGINYSAWCTFEHADQKERNFEQLAKSLQELGPTLSDFDISWNMEVVNRFENYLLNTAKEARRLTDMVGHPKVNILLDIFHGMIEEDDLAEAIRIAGDKLGHYHMGSNNRYLPRPCFLPWQDVCNALNEIGYDKSISFEPLVRSGGTVARDGGAVWREMLPAGTTDEDLDRTAVRSREYIEAMINVGRK